MVTDFHYYDKRNKFSNFRNICFTLWIRNRISYNESLLLALLLLKLKVNWKIKTEQTRSTTGLKFVHKKMTSQIFWKTKQPRGVQTLIKKIECQTHTWINYCDTFTTCSCYVSEKHNYRKKNDAWFEFNISCQLFTWCNRI